MRFAEHLVSRVVLGAIAPVVLMLAGWWGALGVLGDSPWILRMALIGLAAGVGLDFTVLRSRLDSLYRLSAPALTGVAAFYSVMIYGFFMGLPVVNLMVGIGWGFAIGRRHAGEGMQGEAQAEVRVASWIAAAMLLVLCCATAWMALTEPSIAAEVRGMLGLSFTPSMNALRALSLLGGAGLVAAEYFVTLATAKWAAGPAPAKA